MIGLPFPKDIVDSQAPHPGGKRARGRHDVLSSPRSWSNRHMVLHLIVTSSERATLGPAEWYRLDGGALREGAGGTVLQRSPS